MEKIISSNKIYVSNSKIAIAGRGVFADIEIKKGEIIESCPFIEIPEFDHSRLGESTLINYLYFFGNRKQRVLLALGFGSIYNHSYSPNAVYKIMPEEYLIEFISLKKIKKAEEITVNYVQGNKKYPPLWFEK